MYQCKCIGCKKDFTSEDNADFDGEAFCGVCKEKNKEIAKNIDILIANRRAAKGDKPKIQIFDMEKARKNKGTYLWNV